MRYEPCISNQNEPSRNKGTTDINKIGFDEKELMEVSYRPVDGTKGSNPRFGIRHLQVLVLFFMLGIAYGIRASLSVALVAMTSQSSTNPEVKILDWDKKTQDVIMSSFFWGYMVMQLPSGYISIKYGGKVPITIALVINGVLSFSIPIIAVVGGWKIMCIVRVIQGFTQGMLIPCIHGLMGKWAPAGERARLGSIIFGGGFLGIVISMIVAGFLSATSFGWPIIFYAVGGVSLLVAIVWQFVGANSPSEHKYISQEERDYIQGSIGQNTTKRVTNVPWRAILSSAPVWAICFGHTGQGWGQITLMTQIPAFMSKVMKVNIAESGSLSALPFLGKFLGSIFFGFLFDYLVNHGFLSRVVARKCSNTIANWPVAVGLIILAFAPNNVAYVETLLIILCTLLSGASAGCLVNHLDLSPNYSGTLMSLSNFCANFVSIFAPITAGFLLNADDTNVLSWRIVFFVSAGIHIVTNIFYLLMSSAEVLPWDDPDYNQQNIKEKSKDVLAELAAVIEDKTKTKNIDHKEQLQD